MREDGVESRTRRNNTDGRRRRTRRIRRRNNNQNEKKIFLPSNKQDKNRERGVEEKFLEQNERDDPPTEEKTEVPSLFSHYKKPHLFLLRLLLLLRLFSTSIMDEMRGRSGLDPKRVTESNVHSNYIIVCSQLRV